MEKWVGEIKEGQRKRGWRKDKELNVEGQEDWAVGICFNGCHLSFFDQEHLHPREVLVFGTVMPFR